MTPYTAAWTATLAWFYLDVQDRRRARHRASWALRVQSETPEARAARLARRRASPAEREGRQRWKAANRERVVAYNRMWRASNPERVREYERRRRERRAAERQIKPVSAFSSEVGRGERGCQPPAANERPTAPHLNLTRT